VLGWLDSREAQVGLLTIAADDKTADDVKISLYKSLATNAKQWGNRWRRADRDACESCRRSGEPRRSQRRRRSPRRPNLAADQAKSLI